MPITMGVDAIGRVIAKAIAVEKIIRKSIYEMGIILHLQVSKAYVLIHFLII